MVEEIVVPASEERRGGLGGTDAAPPQPIGEITAEDLPRFSTGSGSCPSLCSYRIRRRGSHMPVSVSLP